MLSACVPAVNTWTHSTRLLASSHSLCVETIHRRSGCYDANVSRQALHDTTQIYRSIKKRNVIVQTCGILRYSDVSNVVETCGIIRYSDMSSVMWRRVVYYVI